MDLEWNNTYCKKKKGFMNEIIEIGAVKLNNNLDIVDTFSVFIKAQLGKKLHARVKELTNITNDDISSGTPFSQAMSNFRNWVSHEEIVILTENLNKDYPKKLILICSISFVFYLHISLNYFQVWSLQVPCSCKSINLVFYVPIDSAVVLDVPDFCIRNSLDL